MNVACHFYCFNGNKSQQSDALLTVPATVYGKLIPKIVCRYLTFRVNHHYPVYLALEAALSEPLISGRNLRMNLNNAACMSLGSADTLHFLCTFQSIS